MTLMSLVSSFCHSHVAQTWVLLQNGFLPGVCWHSGTSPDVQDAWPTECTAAGIPYLAEWCLWSNLRPTGHANMELRGRLMVNAAVQLMGLPASGSWSCSLPWSLSTALWCRHKEAETFIWEWEVCLIWACPNCRHKILNCVIKL